MPHSPSPPTHSGEEGNIVRCKEYSNRGRKGYSTAAPQCPFPDAWVGQALNTSPFDYVWVQFYIPTCQYAPGGISNHEDAWNRWTTDIPATKILLGLPASPEAAGSGFMPAVNLTYSVLPAHQRIYQMLWSKYYDDQTGCSSFFKNDV